MTGQLLLRELPVRVPVADGESLHSWIEALAARYRMTVRELLPSLGIPVPHTPCGLVLDISDSSLRSLEWQTGLRPGRLHHTVLDRYSALGLTVPVGLQPGGGRQSLWTRSAGSAFCPRCLTENGGRWQLAWHLNWTFACTRHNVLMASHCPACRRRPREGENRLDHVVDSSRCCHYDLKARPGLQPVPGMPRCGTLLTGQPAHELGPGHPLIACQQWINRILAVPSRVTVAGLQVPPKAALAAVATLMRSAAVTGGPFGTRDVPNLAPGPVTVGIRLPVLPPARSAAGIYSAASTSPALFGTLAALAADVLASPSLDSAAGAVSWMLEDAERRPGPGGAPWRRQIEAAATGSAVLNAIALRHREARMGTAARLTFRTGNAVPRRPPADDTDAGRWPFRPGRMISLPPRLVPQAAWEPVVRALSPHGIKDTGVLAAALSMAIVRCGTYSEWNRVAAWLMLPPQLGRTATAVFGRLDAAGHLKETLAGIDALVEEMTEHPPPIDYARRRWLFRGLGTVTPSRLRRACHEDGLVLTGRRVRYATMMLWETLTGGDIRFAGQRLKPQDHRDRAEYMEFTSTCGEALREYMVVEGERLLLRNNINEPVMWQPEPADPAGQAWRSAPADLTRRLPGWENPSRQARLRRGARDHTPRETS